MTKREAKNERKDELVRLRNSIEALERRFNAFFETVFDFPSLLRPLWDGDRCCLEAVSEVQETDTEIIISVDLPLVKKDDIEITTTEDQLIIQAKTHKTMQFERWGTMQRELQFQSFSKGVPLPKGIDVDKIRASFQNGILEIRIPKAQKRKHIPIK